MASELEIKDKNQKELETDLTSAKHKLLEVQHQLNMAEKVMFFFGNIKAKILFLNSVWDL